MTQHGGKRQRRRPTLALAERATSNVPEAQPPSQEWLASTAERWVDLWQSGAPVVAAIEPSDLLALRRLFDLYDESERALRSFRRKRVVPGSQGQPVLNPVGRVWTDLAAEIRQLEDRFGLTPLARLKLGHQGATAALTLAELNRTLEESPPDEDDPRLDVIDAA